LLLAAGYDRLSELLQPMTLLAQETLIDPKKILLAHFSVQ
jgi:hypothetical protein